MAEFVEVRTLDEICQCSICLDRFHEPKTLNCQHSFCRGCLESSLLSGGPSNLELLIDILVGCAKFHCPLCRAVTTVPVKSAADPFAALAGNFQLKQVVELLNKVAPISKAEKPAQCEKHKSKVKGNAPQQTARVQGGRNRDGANDASENSGSRSSARREENGGRVSLYNGDSSNATSTDSTRRDVVDHIESFVTLFELMQMHGTSDVDSLDSDLYELTDGFQCSTCGSYDHVDVFCPWSSNDYDEEQRSCSRCGRNNHRRSNCFATRHINGTTLVDEVSSRGTRVPDQHGTSNSARKRSGSNAKVIMKCYRCGRSNHTHKNCHARYHAHGHFLSDNVRLCVRCGHKNHQVENCRAEFSVDGFRILY